MNAPAQVPATKAPLLPDTMQDGLKKLLPASMSPDRFFTLVMAAYNKTPELRDCTRESLFLAIRQAAELGLEPNSVLGHGYLIPFKEHGTPKCVFVPGFKGYVYKAKKCAGIVVWSDVVYEGEEFDFQRGTNPQILHRPDFTVPRQDANIIAAYAVARDPGWQIQFEVLAKADVEKIRAGSKGKDGFGWTKHFPEMAKKTAVRRLAKYLPIDNAEWAKLMEVDNENDGMVQGPRIKSSGHLQLGMEAPAEEASATPAREPGQD